MDVAIAKVLPLLLHLEPAAGAQQPAPEPVENAGQPLVPTVEATDETPTDTAQPAPESLEDATPPEEPEPVQEPAPAAQDDRPPPEQPSTVMTTSDPFSNRPVATDPEPSPIEQTQERERSDETDARYQREGTSLALAGGLGQCGTACSYLPVLGGARLELGYRWGHVAIGASTSLIGAKYSTAESGPDDIYGTSDEDGRIQFFQIGPFAQFFLATTGRLDPYLHIGFGYHRFTRTSDVAGSPDSFRWKYWAQSPGVTLGGGVPVFVTDRIQLGARFDKSIQFSGQVCRTIDGAALPDESRCESWNEESQDLNAIDRRFDRLTRPRPWLVSFEARFMF